MRKTMRRLERSSILRSARNSNLASRVGKGMGTRGGFGPHGTGPRDRSDSAAARTWQRQRRGRAEGQNNPNTRFTQVTGLEHQRRGRMVRRSAVAVSPLSPASLVRVHHYRVASILPQPSMRDFSLRPPRPASLPAPISFLPQVATAALAAACLTALIAVPFPNLPSTIFAPRSRHLEVGSSSVDLPAGPSSRENWGLAGAASREPLRAAPAGRRQEPPWSASSPASLHVPLPRAQTQTSVLRRAFSIFHPCW